MEPSLVLSIVSICITILFGVWNAKITVENHNMRKDEFLRNRQRFFKEEFDKRPKLEIQKTKKNIEGKGKQSTLADVDCLVVPIFSFSQKEGRALFTYDEKVLNKADWVNIEFKLKNIGKSSITEFWVAWNSAKNTAMFDVKDDEYMTFVKNNMLNYRVLFEKELKQNDEVTLRFNFHKDYIMYGLISAEASIWLFDEFKHIWEQPLFVHRNVIYDAQQSTHKEFKNLTDIDDAIKCFKEPYLW